jgi:hypothetical protein
MSWFHTLQGTQSATPDALRCHRLCRTCRRFNSWIFNVILFCLFHVVCFDCDFGDGLSVSFGDELVSHAAANKIGSSGCSALSQALPHLSALQQLYLGGNLILFVSCSLFLIVTLGMDCR